MCFTLKQNPDHYVNRMHKKLKRFSCELCNYTSYTKFELKRHLIVHHAQKNEVGQERTHILMKEAQKDQMFVSIEKVTIQVLWK
jgi:hypothetical protein